MGVIKLWPILEPAKQHIPMSGLKGQTLAVDLSIWIVENNGVKGLQAAGVTKPHLRNLFFRVSNLLQLGVNLVFVIEGDAPELKLQTMAYRQQAARGGRKGATVPARVGSKRRPQLKAKIRECCELLDYLGVPYIQSEGEAEAMCALLNAKGLVDACVTDDGDAFLYGARRVYKNFTLNIKDPHVESYTMADIHLSTGLTRDHLVAMALLLGCDYIPKGVPSIGKEQAMKLMKQLEGVDVLHRFTEWTCPSFDTQDKSSIELNVRKKAMIVNGFPSKQVIDEFLVSRNRCPDSILSWRRPDMQRLQIFNYDKLDWAEVYTQEKVLPLTTLWDIQDITRAGNVNFNLHLKPERIVKSRVKQGIPCYEVEWVKPSHIKIIHVEDDVEPKPWITFEERDIFTRSHPGYVRIFEEEQGAKKSKGTKKTRKEKKPPAEDVLSSELAKVSVAETGREENRVITTDTCVMEHLQTIRHPVAAVVDLSEGDTSIGDGCNNHETLCELEVGSTSIVGADDSFNDTILPLMKRLALKSTTEKKESSIFNKLSNDAHSQPNQEIVHTSNSLSVMPTKIKLTDFDIKIESGTQMNLERSSEKLSRTKSKNTNALPSQASDLSLSPPQSLKTTDYQKREQTSTPSISKLDSTTFDNKPNLLFLSPVVERCHQRTSQHVAVTHQSPRSRHTPGLDSRNISDILFDSELVATPKPTDMSMDSVFDSPNVDGTKCNIFCDESSISLFDVSVNLSHVQSCDVSQVKSCDVSHVQSCDQVQCKIQNSSKDKRMHASDSLCGDFNLQTSLLNYTSFHDKSVNNENRRLQSSESKENFNDNVFLHQTPKGNVSLTQKPVGKNKVISNQNDITEGKSEEICEINNEEMLVNKNMKPTLMSIAHNSPISLADRLKLRLSKTSMSTALQEMTNTQ